MEALSCSRFMFRCVCVFPITRFGDAALLLHTSNVILRLLIRLARVYPIALLFLCPRMRCLALKSPSLFYPRRWDRYPYGKKQVPIITGPVVEAVSGHSSSKSLIILTVMLHIIVITTPSFASSILLD